MSRRIAGTEKSSDELAKPPPQPVRTILEVIGAVLGAVLFLILAGLSTVLVAAVALIMPLFLAAMWLAESRDVESPIGVLLLVLLALLSIVVGYGIIF